jgi:hypothetical protein
MTNSIPVRGRAVTWCRPFLAAASRVSPGLPTSGRRSGLHGQIRATEKREGAKRVPERAAVIDHARLMLEPADSIMFALCEVARWWGCGRKLA